MYLIAPISYSKSESPTVLETNWYKSLMTNHIHVGSTDHGITELIRTKIDQSLQRNKKNEFFKGLFKTYA